MLHKPWLDGFRAGQGIIPRLFVKRRVVFLAWFTIELIDVALRVVVDKVRQVRGLKALSVILNLNRFCAWSSALFILPE